MTYDAEYHAKYYQENRDKMLLSQKERTAKKCPEAMRAYRKAYYEKNREKILAQQRERSRKNYQENKEAYARRGRRARLKMYGLTEAQYDEMYEAQDGSCAICRATQGRRKEKDHPLLVDHCHATGKVRGLLCQPCNSALGMFEDNTERMRKAIAYLNSSSSGAT